MINPIFQSGYFGNNKKLAIVNLYFFETLVPITIS
jgi:hypothetical protein